MHALIISTNGEDYVHVSGSRDKLEKKALDFIKETIKTDSPSWEEFGIIDIEKLLLETLAVNEADSAMELFADISDVRSEMVFMRIVPAELEMDA